MKSLRLILPIIGSVTIASVCLLRAQSPSPSPTAAAQSAAATGVTQTQNPTTKKMSQEELKKKLTPIQYNVTCQSGTEQPFHNEYWNNHKPGLYVDLVNGKVLFSSTDKFDSGTGWPSFTKPVVKDNLKSENDSSLGMDREEVRSKDSDLHLGHVFDDGPADKGGMRYCINSAALRFIPVDKLKEEGYSEYLPLFEKQDKK